MSRIKSKWTSPERTIHDLLKANKIKHKMHPKTLGSPDIAFKDSKTVLYIHGCFWHGCKKCYRKPSNNKKFWETKLRNNISRDRKNIRKLKKDGWVVLTLWEHDVKKNPKGCVSKILKALD